MSTAAIRQALAELTLPGRFEIVGQRPTVVVDVAHNVASAEALVDTLEASYPSKQRVLVLAASRDKDVRGIVRALVPHFEQVVVTKYQENPRAVSVAKLGQTVRKEFERLGFSDSDSKVYERELPADAWQLAKQLATAEHLICVTGSFFIVAELRAQLTSAGGTSLPEKEPNNS